MIDIVLKLMLIYAFLFFTGYGLHLFLTPPFLNKKYLTFLLVPSLGYAQMAILSLYGLALAIHLETIVQVSIGLSIATLVIFILLQRYFLKNTVKNQNTSCQSYCHTILQKSIFPLPLRHVKAYIKLIWSKVLIFLLLLLIILSPVIKAGFPTTPYRHGIDVLGYSQSAEYLFEGHTVRQLKHTVRNLLNDSNLYRARKNIYKTMSYNTIINFEFFLFDHRWGFPAITAELTKVVKASHVFNIVFLLLIFNYALLIGLSYFLMRQLLKIPGYIAFWASVALALNCNLLNLTYEGQYAEIFIEPYFILLLIIFLIFKRYTEEDAFKHKLNLFRSPKLLQTILFASVILAAFYVIYSWAIFTILLFIGLIFIVDFVLTKKFNLRLFYLTGVTGVFGLIWICPFALKWFINMLSIIPNLKAAGFPQPHWASFLEILGIFDIYSHLRVAEYTIQSRSIWWSAILIIVSTLFLISIFRYLWKEKRSDIAFWVTPLLFIFLIFLKTMYFEKTFNYQYMKVYTMCLPFVFGLSTAVLYFRIFPKNKYSQFFKVFLLLAVMFNGIAYLNQYMEQGSYITKSMIDLHQKNVTDALDDGVVYTLNTAGLSSNMMAAVIPMNWLNYSFAPQQGPQYFGKTVYLIYDKTQVPCGNCIIARNPNGILYENPQYIIVNTHRHLEQVCSHFPCPALQDLYYHTLTGP